MLVQCEFYQVGEIMVCDLVCEHCGEVALYGQHYSDVVQIVHGTKPVLCPDCEEKKCRVCGKMPTPKEMGKHWINGVCWPCREQYYQRLIEQVKDVVCSIPE